MPTISSIGGFGHTVSSIGSLLTMCFRNINSLIEIQGMGRPRGTYIHQSSWSENEAPDDLWWRTKSRRVQSSNAFVQPAG